MRKYLIPMALLFFILGMMESVGKYPYRNCRSFFDDHAPEGKWFYIWAPLVGYPALAGCYFERWMEK